ncbi:MAG: phosphoribosylanthranilate isomerase [Verrucomicrobiia bacterium]
MSVKIKICGITNLDDARLAAELGADALGFVFYPKSLRRVTLEQAASICKALPPFVATVGVFVNATQREIESALAPRGAGLTILQFHGDESPEFCRKFAARTIKAIRVQDEDSLRAAAEYDVDALLLDTYTEAERGGTGSTFDWSIAVRAKEIGLPIILSGGLTTANIHEAIRKVRPYAVDVSSGVESEPGRKDPEKLRRFIELCKSI